MSERFAPVADPTPRDVFAALRRGYDELTNSQKRIAETIVEDPEFVAFATLGKFAARIGVASSTIVRFAYRIGLSGYPELQELVRELVFENLRTTSAAGGDPTSRLGAGPPGESLRNDISLLAKTAERLAPDDLSRAIELVIAAERVRVVGGLTAFGVAYSTAVTLDRVRSRVSLLHSNPVPTGSLLEMEAGDVLIAFSFAPYARSTLGAITAAKGRGASVIAISDSPISPLRGNVDILVPAAASGIGTQNSLVGAMAVANALVNGVAGKMPGALERYGETIQLLDEWDMYLLETTKREDT